MSFEKRYYIVSFEETVISFSNIINAIKQCVHLELDSIYFALIDGIVASLNNEKVDTSSIHKALAVMITSNHGLYEYIITSISHFETRLLSIILDKIPEAGLSMCNINAYTYINQRCIMFEISLEVPDYAQTQYM